MSESERIMDECERGLRNHIETHLLLEWNTSEEVGGRIQHDLAGWFDSAKDLVRKAALFWPEARVQFTTDSYREDVANIHLRIAGARDE